MLVVDNIRMIQRIRNATFCVRVWWYLLLILGSPAAVMAQAPASQEPLQIIINSGRLEKPLEEMPAAATVLEHEAIHGGRQQLGLDQALANVPGIFALNRYNFAQDLRLSIRGFGARANFGIRGVRILIDGMPATTPDGQSSIDDIDLGNLARVEIIRGPAGALYGSSAGGVLSLETEKGKGPPSLEAGFSAGAYGFRDVKFKGSGARNYLSYSLNASRLSIDGYRAQSVAQRDVLNGRFDYSLAGGGEFTAVLALLDAPLAQDAGGLTAEQVSMDRSQAAPLNVRFDTSETIRQQRFGLHSRHPLDSNAELRLRGYYVQRDFANRLPFNKIELDRRFGGSSVEYVSDNQWLGTPGRLLLGLDIDYQDDMRRRLDNLDGVTGDLNFEQRERVLSSGIFIAREHNFSARIRLDMGLRYDYLRIEANDRFLSDGDDSASVIFTRWSPSIALLMQQNNNTRYYARIATGFETPTTTELSRPDGSGGFNKTLMPESTLSYELGVRKKLTQFVHGEIALFESQIEDQLVPFGIANSPDRFAYENAGRSRNRGLESALSIGEYTGWSIQLAYTYSHFLFINFTDQNGQKLDGKRLPGVPENLFNLELRYRTNFGVFVALETRYTGRYYADNNNNIKITPSMVSGLRIAYQQTISHWQLHVRAGINNLSNENYYANIRLNATAERYYEPAPPRHVYIGFSARYFF